MGSPTGVVDIKSIKQVFGRLGAALVGSATVLALAGACGDSQSPAAPPLDPDCPTDLRANPASLSTLPCPSAFSILSTRPDAALFSNTAVVKFVVDLQDGGATYFVNGRQYGLHYTFCADFLDVEGFDPVGTHAEFNTAQYRRPDRRFLLGTLAFYGDQQVAALELATGDTMDADQVLMLYDHLVSRVYFGSDLVYRPVSLFQEAMAAEELAGLIPLVSTQELYEGITYQPLNTGQSVGTLRLIGDGPASSARVSDIVVLREAPNDIRPVAGVITERFQTPLSHVNILSKNRGTPNMALAGALTDPRLLPFADKLVFLEVGPQDFTVRQASEAEFERYWAQVRPSSTFVPPLDLGTTGLLDLDQLDLTALPTIGAKAANMAEMTGIETLRLPASPFAIPFAHYWDHMATNGLDEQVQQLLDDPRFANDPQWRAERLALIRQAIATAPMDRHLTAQLEVKVRSLFGETRVRFRSSTNSEDLPNFNGAGLYSSASGQAGDPDKAIEDAVRKVWASLWNEAAVAERDFYRIDHTAVAMAVLVHPAFPDEEANGVALTLNIFNPMRPGFFVNAQHGEASVTNPGPGEIPDQFIIYTWYEEPEIEYLSRSNLGDGGQPVLTEVEILELEEDLREIHTHFAEAYETQRGQFGFGMDVEFKVVGEARDLVVKQARPMPR